MHQSGNACPAVLGRDDAGDADKPAVIMGRSGQVLTYGDIETRSRAVSAALADAGLTAGDHVAILAENHVRYLEICWAALRAGLYITPINWHLTTDEVGYIVDDCGARVLFATAMTADLARQVAERAPRLDHVIDIDGSGAGLRSIDDFVAWDRKDHSPEIEGSLMMYSSGTTGRPKGIRRALVAAPFGTPNRYEAALGDRYGFDDSTVYLNPAPLYHSAPLAWSLMTQRRGGTVVVMESFDADEVLTVIERHRVTHAQFVPTMFTRLLRLPDDRRDRADVSSLQVVVHAAAPCPIDVKRRMLEWWGPVIHEFYASSEGGFVSITPEEWLLHPGSVGKPVMPTRIVGDDGVELGPGEVGLIQFQSAAFEYHNDPVKTAQAVGADGWATVGDFGRIDADGYLHIADRRDDLVIVGGVNVYPREVEDVLLEHPAVDDAAVIGVSHPEYGHEVRAVVQLVKPDDASDALADELIAWCRSRLAKFKCPRSVDFRTSLPRLPTGKLLRRVLRDEYETSRG